MSRIAKLCTLICALPFAVSAFAAEARSEEKISALVYPSGAKMRLERTLPVRNGRISFDLPYGADVQSLDLTLKGRNVVGFEAARVPGKANPAAAALRNALEEARRNAALLEGEKASLDARLALWTTPPIRGFTQAADLEKTDALMAARITELHVSRALLDPRLEEARRVVERLEARFREAGGELGDVERITAGVLPAEDGEVEARIVFTLHNCGWQPVYRLDALPGKDMVRVTQLAEIRQGTGLEWKNVDLVLTTANPGAGLNPLPLRPWVVGPVPEAAFALGASNDAAAPQASAPTLRKASAAGAVMAAPLYRADAVSGSWTLGERDIPAGIPVLLTLDQSDWKAEFVRVLRPSQGKFAYLRARVTPPEPASLPGGSAQFLVDGTGAGKGMFSFSGSEGDIFFGEDPRVSATMELDTRQSGSRGFINKKQTRAWVWTIDVHNAHTDPVAVLVEEPAPQLRDEEVTLDLRSSPKPETDGRDYVWRLTVPGGGTKKINHAVTIAAPVGMRLDDGR